MKSSSKVSSEFIRTEGGLVRSIRLGCPEDTMHLWWNGAFLAPVPEDAADPARECGEIGEFLVEIELLRIEGDKVTVRLCAPAPVRIVSARKDPHVRTNAASLREHS